MAIAPNFGVPDWHDLDGYPAINSPSIVWAWEFLRRNPAYRAFYKEKISPFIADDGRISKNVAGVIWPHHKELMDAFAVDIPSAPDEPTPPIFCKSGVRYVQNDKNRDVQGILLEHGEAAFIIDLSKPLKSQFERAIIIAERLQTEIGPPRKTRRRPEKYPIYLRIIDALDAGEKPSEIADYLYAKIAGEYADGFPQRKAFSDDRATAEGLRDGGYRTLI